MKIFTWRVSKFSDFWESGATFESKMEPRRDVGKCECGKPYNRAYWANSGKASEQLQAERSREVLGWCEAQWRGAEIYGSERKGIWSGTKCRLAGREHVGAARKADKQSGKYLRGPDFRRAMCSAGGKYRRTLVRETTISSLILYVFRE